MEGMSAFLHGEVGRVVDIASNTLLPSHALVSMLALLCFCCQAGSAAVDTAYAAAHEMCWQRRSHQQQMTHPWSPRRQQHQQSSSLECHSHKQQGKPRTVSHLLPLGLQLQQAATRLCMRQQVPASTPSTAAKAAAAAAVISMTRQRSHSRCLARTSAGETRTRWLLD
jgi:hypothetical protein